MSKDYIAEAAAGILRYTGTDLFARFIPKAARVLVVGVGPGGVDVSRVLVESGHTGPITLASRSGRLPKVQRLEREYLFDALVQGKIEDLEVCSRTLPVTLEMLAGAFYRLIQLADPSFRWDQLWNPPKDALAELKNDIAHSEAGGARYQNVVNSIGRDVWRLWRLLSHSERNRFMKSYESTWRVYRHAIPLGAAKWMREMLQSGQLRIGRLIDLQADGGQVCAAIHYRPGGYDEITFDRMVDATGPNYFVETSRNPLVMNILKNRFATAHPFGGFAIDVETLRLQGHECAFVLGALTRGEVFYTNAFPPIIDQARRIVVEIIGSLKQK